MSVSREVVDDGSHQSFALGGAAQGRAGSCQLTLRCVVGSSDEGTRARRVGVLDFDGELDACTAQLAQSTCFVFLDDCDAARIDLGGVTFIDSAGCRLLEQCAERLDRRGAECEFDHASGFVRRLFGMLGLDGLIATSTELPSSMTRESAGDDHDRRPVDARHGTDTTDTTTDTTTTDPTTDS